MYYLLLPIVIFFIFFKTINQSLKLSTKSQIIVHVAGFCLVLFFAFYNIASIPEKAQYIFGRVLVLLIVISIMFQNLYSENTTIGKVAKVLFYVALIGIFILSALLMGNYFV